VSLSTCTSGAVERDYFMHLRRRGSMVTVALMVVASAVAVFDLYLFAASAIH
jgi:hypothetical protein